MITHMESDKKLNSFVTEVFVKGRKHNLSIIFLSQSYSKVSITKRLSATCYFILKNPNNRKLQQVPSNHSSDMTILVNNTIFSSNNS